MSAAETYRTYLLLGGHSVRMKGCANNITREGRRYVMGMDEEGRRCYVPLDSIACIIEDRTEE